MAISNNGVGIRPGVCTSTTRPVSPYEGQHIYETDTDIEYVWNGTAWVVNYVSAASPAFTGTPTAPTATAGTNTTQLATTAFSNTAGGLVLLSTTNFTSAWTQQFVSAFSSSYTNYRAVFSYTASSAQSVYFRWLVGTTVQTGNNYTITWGASYSGGSWTGNTRGDQYMFTAAGYPTYPTTYTVDFFNPQGTGYTSWTVGSSLIGTSGTDAQIAMFASHNVATTQFDGFEITTANGAISLTGSMSLYGYKK